MKLSRSKRSLSPTACVALLLTAASLSAHEPAIPELSTDMLRRELRQVIGEARDHVFPSLVSIRVVVVQYYGGKEIKGNTLGSGTIITPQGHVLTNQHVTKNGKKFVCTLSDKREISAQLVGEDPLTDLAVLQLDLEALGSDGTGLPVAHFGDSDQLETGDYVMAMGSPFSLSRSVSLGIVSNTERVFAGGFGSDDVEDMELEQGQRTGLFTRWIQHDALIHPGNSGGPLVDLEGKIVGINELGASAMGFAIPANLARRVSSELIAHGEVVRSWIGASFKPIQRTGLSSGVLISSVVVGGPAARAGVEAGDVLLELAGESVTVRFTEEVPLLLDRLAALPVGSEIELLLQREETAHRVRVRTEKLAKDVGAETSFHAWGFSGQEITEKMARDLQLAGANGVLVTGVVAGGPAQTAEPALADGDVIRALDGVAVADLAQLIARYETLAGRSGKVEDLLVELDRRGKNQLTLLSPRQEALADPPRELPKAWIGVATQPIHARLAGQLGLGAELGFRITRVYAGTEAERAGLAVGDLVVALDGEPLLPAGNQDAGLLTRRVRALEIGAPARLTLLRGGERLEVAVVLERTRLLPEEARRFRDGDFELSVRELTFFDRDENRWSSMQRGVLVEQVEAAGWAGLAGVRAGDLVLRVEGETIAGLESFRQVLQKLKNERPERIEVVVLRGAKTYFQFLEPDWAPSETEP